MNMPTLGLVFEWTSVTTAITNLFAIATTAFEFIVGNPILLVLLCSSFVGLAFGIFRKGKKATR